QHIQRRHQSLLLVAVFHHGGGFHVLLRHGDLSATKHRRELAAPEWFHPRYPARAADPPVPVGRPRSDRGRGCTLPRHRRRPAILRQDGDRFSNTHDFQHGRADRRRRRARHDASARGPTHHAQLSGLHWPVATSIWFYLDQ